MEYFKKELLFKEFENKWHHQLNKVPHILNTVLSYPEIQDRFKDFEPIEFDNLHETQLEWVSLIAQFDKPIETSFFKNYWVPIQKNGYDYFIDLSSDKIPVFEVHYFFFEPYRWYKEYIIDDAIYFQIL